MNKKDELLKIFSLGLRNILTKTNMDYEKLQEIRLRANGPLIVIYDNKEFFVTNHSKLSKNYIDAVMITRNEIKETMEYISNFSLYAFEEEIKQGFITIQGGHRVGIAGKTILDEEKVKSMKHISFINIRLSHQIKGCADKVIPYIQSSDMNDIYHTLIISPPRCGKTTLLRDIIRQLSNGESDIDGFTVGVVDERSEIGACYMGIPQNDLGIRTDILDCCPKAKGMMMLIRSMSPRIIAVDEVGLGEDIEAIEYVINCGCKIIATVHGSSIEDIRNKPILGRLVKEKVFERYIVLNNRKSVGNIEQIFDERGSILYQTVS
ncbi:stage III sporulation protein AA [Mobilisporobacter senegalensis]|uniref:Stage III sporulation protein AA n=1 Tax=Mobilisporobacter senegalensis TaxID=1329262 RepID=A0A3N1XQS9_9FIRM|nr:stage III sporulation protein AA [Mobilisporobacter senegalensis]ROR27137.1 stage III sporulation protein AA [Mobilisporobacter senegalensis]